MGSTTSRPSSPVASTTTAPSTTHTTNPRPNPNRPSGTLARLNSLRRLSTLGRRNRERESDAVGVTKFKRGRQGSSNSDSPVLGGDKKRRFRASSPALSPTRELGESSQSQTRPTGSTQVSERSPKTVSRPLSIPTVVEQGNEDMDMELMDQTHVPYPQPRPPTLGLPVFSVPSIPSHPTSSNQPSITLSPPAASVPLPITPSSEASDPLAAERLQSLATIRDALGPDRASQLILPAPPTDRLLHRFRRSSSFPELSAQAPQPQRTMSDRLTAFLGFSTPVDEAPSSQPQTESDTQPVPDMSTELEQTESAIELLEQRLERARAELAQTQRQLDEASEARQRAEESIRRRPTGPVLVIQGLAQTHNEPSEEEEETPANSNPRRPGVRTRRSSEGSTSSRVVQPSGDRDSPSLEAQARMIGGLLTVAAAATATTLLAPDQPALPSPSNRSPAASALETIMNRLRPSRASRTQSVEAALSSYLRSALQTTRSSEQENSGENIQQSTDDQADTHVSDEFQRFLEGLQVALVGAVRDFAGPLPLSSSTEEEAGDADSFVTATEGIPTPTPATPSTETPTQDTLPLPYPQPGSATQAGSDSLPPSASVPSFHPQLGQNLPNAAGTGLNQRPPVVLGGADGNSRRLDFFRAHLFPPISSTGRGRASEDDTEAMVPCVFVGVRSIRHDPSMTREDLVQHPSFPFVDGQVPSTLGTDDPSQTNGTASSTALAPAPAPASASSPSSPPERRSLRERVLDRLNPNRVVRPARPMSTYLIYVIGGNYPRNHPVLSIPNLLTGGALTTEEMALVSELMGPGKPPTVGQEEIEKSGLRIVRGHEMAEENKKGALLDTCVDRCLICLSEYETDDSCRILNCRHGYHKECVDQWLSTGRNSCPACRSEAVDTSKSATTSTSTTASSNEGVSADSSSIPSGESSID